MKVLKSSWLENYAELSHTAVQSIQFSVESIIYRARILGKGKRTDLSLRNKSQEEKQHRLSFINSFWNGVSFMSRSLTAPSLSETSFLNWKLISHNSKSQTTFNTKFSQDTAFINHEHFTSGLKAKKVFSTIPRLSRQTSVWYKTSDPIFSFNFLHKLLELTTIKSMRSNEVHIRHHNFIICSDFKMFPRSGCRCHDAMKFLPIKFLLFSLSNHAWNPVCCHPPPPILIHDNSSSFMVSYTLKNKSSPVVVPCYSSTTSEDSVMPRMAINNWVVSLVSLLLSSAEQNFQNYFPFLHLFPQYTFMACCSVKAQEQIYLFTFLSWLIRHC
jgi:hypothetical protein